MPSVNDGLPIFKDIFTIDQRVEDRIGVNYPDKRRIGIMVGRKTYILLSQIAHFVGQQRVVGDSSRAIPGVLHWVVLILQMYRWELPLTTLNAEAFPCVVYDINDMFLDERRSLELTIYH